MAIEGITGSLWAQALRDVSILPLVCYKDQLSSGTLVTRTKNGQKKKCRGWRKDWGSKDARELTYGL